MTIQCTERHPDELIEDLLKDGINKDGTGVIALRDIDASRTEYAGIQSLLNGGFVKFYNSLGEFRNTYMPWLNSWYPRAICIGLNGLSPAFCVYLFYKFYIYLKEKNYDIYGIVEENSTTVMNLFNQFLIYTFKVDLNSILPEKENDNSEKLLIQLNKQILKP